MKVASYCRVSTDKDDQANSFQAQQRFFREYIQRHPDWELHEVYADEGITGTSTQKRAQFNRMIADAHAGKFSLIITKEISRFSRNILDTISYTRKLKSIGVGVLFMTENLNTLNPESEMLLTFMGTIAQEESRRTSVRVKWGQTRQMERGVVFGRSLLGYDVKDGMITVDPEGAQIVKQIFHKYGIEKKGSSVIARELRNSHTANVNWNAGYIVKILKNEKYVGDLVQKKTITPDYLTHAKKTNHGEEAFVILEDHHEPIISRELWNTVQEELAARNKRHGQGHANRYIFSGKIKCGECGAGFVSRQKTRSDGTKLRRWSCSRAASQGKAACGIGRLVRDDDAVNMLKTAIQNLDLDRAGIIGHVTKLALQARRAGEGEREDAARVRREIERIERKKAAAMDACFSGDITRDEMRAMKAAYDERLGDLQNRLDSCKDMPDDAAGTVIQHALESILSGQADSESFYKTILDRITVYKDRRLELRLNHLGQVFHFQ